jgi:hypothetical protein
MLLFRNGVDIVQRRFYARVCGKGENFEFRCMLKTYRT